MAFEIPIGEPTTLIPGTTWSWNKTLVDFPPSEGWTFSYTLTGASSLTFAASDDGTGAGWTVSVPPSKTQQVAAGPYRLTGTVSLAGNIYTAVVGTVDVAPSPFLDDGTDARAFAEKYLASIEAALLARVNGTGAPVNSYAVDGRSFNLMTLAELRTERNRAAWEVDQLYRGKPEPIVVRFGHPRRMDPWTH